MNVITMDPSVSAARKRGQAEPAKQRTGQLHDISTYAYERDKRKVGLELRDYFVNKNREEEAWNLTGMLMSNLRKKGLSSGEVKKITAFLSGKFVIRLPDIEHAQRVAGSAAGSGGRADAKVPLRIEKREDGVFHRIFLDLQAAVQNDILDFRSARSLVIEMISSYPEAKEALHP